MTYKLLCLIAGCCFGFAAYAEDLTQRVEEVVTQTKEQVAALEDRANSQANGEDSSGQGSQSAPYLVGKYFTSAGTSTRQEGQDLKGEGASGFGFDFGCPFAAPWAWELGYQAGGGQVSSGATTTTTTNTDANYTDLSLSVAYHWAWGPSWVWVGKLGWVRESANLSVLPGSSTRNTQGWIGTLGGQYFLDRHQALVLEWEKNGLPNNPRAYNLFVGFKFVFGP